MAQAKGVPSHKPAFNVYTMLLILSFFSLVIACVLLYMELQSYGDPLRWWDTSAVQPPTTWNVAPSLGAQSQTLAVS